MTGEDDNECRSRPLLKLLEAYTAHGAGIFRVVLSALDDDFDPDEVYNELCMVEMVHRKEYHAAREKVVDMLVREAHKRRETDG